MSINGKEYDSKDTKAWKKPPNGKEEQEYVIQWLTTI